MADDKWQMALKCDKKPRKAPREHEGAIDASKMCGRPLNAAPECGDADRGDRRVARCPAIAIMAMRGGGWGQVSGDGKAADKWAFVCCPCVGVWVGILRRRPGQSAECGRVDLVRTPLQRVVVLGRGGAVDEVLEEVDVELLLDGGEPLVRHLEQRAMQTLLRDEALSCRRGEAGSSATAQTTHTAQCAAQCAGQFFFFGRVGRKRGTSPKAAEGP